MLQAMFDERGWRLERLRLALRLAATALCLALLCPSVLADAAGAPLAGRTIVIDPGHGGNRLGRNW